MKNLFKTLLVVAVCAASYPASAQNSTPEPTHRVGLIDMAHVFQNYKKFENLRNDLQAEIEKSDAQAKTMVDRLKAMQEELKKFSAGSPEYTQAEKQILQAKADFDSFRASTQRKLAARESEMFKTIYSDVTKAVKLYAEYKQYNVVMRFNRKGIDDTTSPAEAVQTMNKTVIYFQNSNDITDVVLGYLNREYGKSAGGTAALPAGSSRTVK